MRLVGEHWINLLPNVFEVKISPIFDISTDENQVEHDPLPHNPKALHNTLRVGFEPTREDPI